MAYQLDILEDMLVLTVDYLLNEVENKALVEEVEEHILNGQKSIIVDLGGMSFMNSVGLNFLLSLLTKSRNAGGETIIVNINDQISKLLVVTKLKDVFSVKDSVEEAKACFVDHA